MRSDIRGSLERHLPRTLPTEDELFAMRRAAWRKQGIVVIRLADVRDEIVAPGAGQRGDAALRPAGGRVMARRKRKTSARVVTGLPMIRGRTSCSSRSTRPIPRGGRSSTTAPSTPSASCCAPARSPRRCTTRRATSRRSSPSPGSTWSAACRLVRLPGGSGPGDLTEAQVDARRRVGQALDALGGLGSPAGSCVWHVVGLQRSIREWAMRQGWGGRPVASSRRRGSWWRRWACWRGSTDTRKADGET